MGQWSRGRILASVAGGPGINSRLSPVLTILYCGINDTPQGESNHIPAGETKDWDNQACKETSRREGTTLSGEKNKPKTLLLHRKRRSGVSWYFVFACGSRSRREKFLDQSPSIPDLTLLEVELLAFYRVSQNSQLLTRSEARTIHTASNHSLRQTQIHGRKGELRHTALNS